MTKIKVENLPAWTENYARKTDWFGYVAPLFIEEYEWHDIVCNGYPTPSLLAGFWETALYQFCTYISMLETFSLECIREEHLAPYSPPENSLNWLVMNIHGVESARRAFEHFVDPRTHMGTQLYYQLLICANNSNEEAAAQQGEHYDVHFWLYYHKSNKKP